MPSLLPISPPLKASTKEPEDVDFSDWPPSALERAVDILIVTDEEPDRWPSLLRSVNPLPIQVS